MKSFLLLVLLFCGYTLHAQTTVKSILSLEGPFKRSIVLRTSHDDSYLPVTIIKGEKKGPVFTVVAGIHGYEYPPIIAALQLIQQTFRDSLSGTLIIIPIANTAAFYKRTPFVNPVDGQNLNRSFPGSDTGTATAQLAHLIATEIIPVSDVFLDIHGGDANEDLLPFICYYDKATALAKTLCEHAGITHIVSYPFNITATEPALYAFKHATQRGITALSIEAGKLGTVQEDNVSLIVNAVRNMLGYLKMYDYKPSGSTQHVYLNNQYYMKAPVSGIFYSNVKAGDKVEKGQYLGHIDDHTGRVITYITADEAGTILHQIATPPVNVRETLFCIGN